MFGNIKKIHLIGIGGIGMSGVAELLNYWDFQVSGSDARKSENTVRLEKLGIHCNIGHQANHVKDVDLVVYSSAIDDQNPELIKAQKSGIPCIKRAQMLGEILRLRPNSIAVSGTHGKTTTTSLIGHIFSEAGRDPLIICGGIIKGLDSTVRCGAGDTIILEADEYDHSFMDLYPTHVVITSIDKEHLDTYADLATIQTYFGKFANRVPFYGKAVVNLDDVNIAAILPTLSVPLLPYSIHKKTLLQAVNIELKKMSSKFVVLSNGQHIGSIHLPLPGIHNIQNCLAAINICLEYNIDFSAIQLAIGSFAGVKRRFDILYQSDNLMLVDDYAHHPAEISATLAAARDGWKHRIIAIFQPHLYSRTAQLYHEFAKALQYADEIILLDIYPAREKPIPGISSQLIADSFPKEKRSHLHYINKLDAVLDLIKTSRQPGDMIITLGAGNVNQLHEIFKKEFI